MIEKKVVFCEMAFLQEFLSSYPRLEPNDESLRLVDAWMSFYQFVCKADICLDISVNDFKSIRNGNEWLFRLWKKSTDGLCGLEFKKDEFPDISSLKGGEQDKIVLNAVFLTTKEDEVCKRKAQELGVFVLNPDMAKHCNHLFYDSGTAFPNERARNWSFLKGLTGSNVCPSINISNSMLIIDNYILYDDWDFDYQNKMKYNLKPILQALLPDKLAEGEIYDITVFVGVRSEDRNKRNLYEAQYNYLRTMIEEIRKGLRFRLSVFVGKDEDKFHDRSIVTNNVLINSGHGFGILRRDGKTNSPTSVNIVFPFFQNKIDWCDNTYINIMRTAKKIMDRLHEPNINCWGDDKEENKLVSYYALKKATPVQPIVQSITKESQKSISHQNGRIIGKMDLSIFNSDGKKRRNY